MSFKVASGGQDREQQGVCGQKTRIKPFPARQAESLPRGWGIMMDDVIAGIYGNLLMHLGIYFWNKW